MQQKFGFNIGQNVPSAKEEIQKLDAQEFFSMKLVPYNEIEVNKLNDFPIIEIEELTQEIKEYGLVEPLGLLLNPEGSAVKYRLYSGERRYTAIGAILKENPDFPKFKNGIPCFINKASDAIEEEIKIILANKQRTMSDEFRRKKAQRLSELYSLRQAETGEKFNITQKVAKDLNVGERQVQRYTAVNNKLIPELQEAFDNSKMTLENAATIANMDVEAQKIILDLIAKNSAISKKEINLVKKEYEMLLKQQNTSSEESIDKDQLKKEIELSTIEKDLIKKLDEYLLLLQNYKSAYKADISNPTLISKFDKIIKILE